MRDFKRATAPIARAAHTAIDAFGKPRIGTIAVLIAFLLVAAASTVALLATPWPRSIVSADTANVATFHAVSVDAPSFANDYIYRDSTLVRHYSTVVLDAATAFWGKSHDTGAFWLGLQFPIVAFMLVGFFIFGRQLCLSVARSAILAILCTAPVLTQSGDFWGAYAEPFVRSTYAAALPWIVVSLLWAIKDGSLGRRFLPIGLAALLGYMHFPSAAAGVGGVLVASLVVKPAGIRTSRWIIFHVCMGALCIGIWLPFILDYFASYVAGQSSGKVVLENLDVENYNASIALGRFIFPWGPYGNFLHACILCAIYIVGIYYYLFAAPADSVLRRSTRGIAGMILGVFLASFGLSIVDQAIAWLLNRAPLQIDLIRGLRFLAPLLIAGAYLFGVTAFAGAKRGWMFDILAVAILIYQVLNPLGAVSLQLRYYLLTRSIVSPEEKDGAQVLTLLREQPRGSTTLFLGSPDRLTLAIRYGARQPLAFAEKDQNIIAHAGRGDLFVVWKARKLLYNAFQDARGSEALANGWGAIEKVMKPQFVVARICKSSSTPCQRSEALTFLSHGYPIILQNNTYMVLKVH